MKRYLFFILLLFIALPFFSNAQIISYDHDIMLPDTTLRSGMPQDIIHADGHIFVYTLKAILIFNESRVYEEKIELGTYGRFAMKYPGPESLIPDSRMMAFDPLNHQLYYVTPTLNVLRINTFPLSTDSTVVINTPDSIFGKRLHGYTKLTYNNSRGRLYWLTLVQNDNYHSWDSFFGIYKKNQASGELTTIYDEYKNGSNFPADYFDIMQTYEYNTSGNDYFYVSRKLKIDVMEILPNDSVIIKKRIPTTSIRIGKMLLVNDNIDLLLSFPATHADTNVLHPEHEKIYQIDTQNPNIYDSIIAPSKVIADAAYLPGQHHIITCFSSLNDNMYQLDTAGRDVAIYSYDNNDGIFHIYQSLCTQFSTEVDTSYRSLNRPFHFLINPNGNALLNKKNEIIDIIYHSTGSYTSNSKYYAKDSFFGKGVSFGNNTFIINSVNSGFEFFNTSFHGTKRTAYPAFNVEYNPTNRKLYFFNRLSTENTGFYIYNLDIGQVETFVETPRSIGDLVYNPVQNHILVSEFSKNTGTTDGIRVYEGNNGTFIQTLSFVGTNYLGRMFVAPNNRIYVSANMKSDNTPPKLLILDASAYSAVRTLNIGLKEDPASSYNLRSHFCYNPYNKKVYAAYTPLALGNPPYQTSYHGSVSPLSDLTSPQDSLSESGWLLSIDGSNNLYVIDTSTIQNIGELICATPDSVNQKSSYQGTLFINGSNSLHILDCYTNALTPVSLSKIIDMDYSSRSNCLYAYYHFHSGQQGLDINKLKVYKVKEDGSYIKIWEKNGFGASLSYNRYDDQLYCYYRSDERMLGGNPAKVFTLDPYAETDAQTAAVSLPTYSFMLEEFPQTNNVFFDPYGKAFFPNGMHSSVSVVNFEGGNEALHLTPGPNWISIPRLDANNGTYYLQADTIPDVFDRNSFAIPYSNLEMVHHRTWVDGEGDYSANWKENISDWSFIPYNSDNQNAFSYRGYTLELEPDGNNTLYMQGQIKDPATTFPLYKDKKNWIGYFLVQEQDVFDALADHLDSITEIWARNYYCYRPNGNDIIFGPEGGGVFPPGGPEWACTNSSHTIKYGEMIKVHPIGNLTVDDDPPDPFYWSTGGNTAPNDPRQGASHYAYTETASYKPIVIELDTSQNPEEIGAFVNDTCVGACSVIEADTAVILMAYLDGRPVDSIEFREYSSAKSSGSNPISSYLVFNNERGVFEKRKVSTKEGNERVLVSFKKRKVEAPETPGLKFNIWPNPATAQLNYNLVLDKAVSVVINLYDINGRLIRQAVNEPLQAGAISGAITLKASNGIKLKPGVYLVQLKAGEMIKTKKVIVK